MFFLNTNQIDFGLSISGYQNQPGANVNGKPPLYTTNDTNQTVERQQIYSLEDYAEKKVSQPLMAKPPTDYRMYDATTADYMNNSEYYPDEGNTTTLPALDKPKFKPTNATQ